jgi:hypothetical protein
VPPQDQHTGTSTLSSSSFGCILASATAADEAAVLVAAIDDVVLATSDDFLLGYLLGSLVTLSDDAFLFQVGDLSAVAFKDAVLVGDLAVVDLVPIAFEG